MQRADRVRHHTADFVIRGINGQLGLDMLDVEESDPFGLPGSSRLGERRVPWGAVMRAAVWPRTSGLETPPAKINQTPMLRISLDMVIPDRGSASPLMTRRILVLLS